ncbi:MAG: hypothetical protein AB1Z98_25835 [Nannocystaceae bacterium]
MDAKQRIEQAIDELRVHAGALRLHAELDPAALRQFAGDFARRAGLDPDVALRVVEDELGVRPLPSRAVVAKRRTVVDVAVQSES